MTDSNSGSAAGKGEAAPLPARGTVGLPPAPSIGRVADQERLPPFDPGNGSILTVHAGPIPTARTVPMSSAFDVVPLPADEPAPEPKTFTVTSGFGVGIETGATVQADSPIPLKVEAEARRQPQVFNETVSEQANAQDTTDAQVADAPTRVALEARSSARSAARGNISVSLSAQGGTREEEILRRLEALERLFQEARPLATALDNERAKIGGNFPPPGMELPDGLPSLSASALEDAFLSLNIIRDEYAADHDKPSKDALSLAERTVKRVGELVVTAYRWAAEFGSRIVVEAIAIGLAENSGELAHRAHDALQALLKLF